MTDLQATLDAIDQLAVHECGHCARPLPADGESLDYCGPDCQASWLAAKLEVDELVGYREPYDLPQHQANLVELRSPEVTPTRPDDLDAAFRHMSEQLHRLFEWTAELPFSLSELPPIGIVFNSARSATPDAAPGLDGSDFGADFDFEWTPATSLPHGPPPAVMPALPERDWQALIDQRSHRAELNRWRIMEQVRHDARTQALDPRGFLRITGA